LAYLEEKALYELGVLESDNWINNNIRSKIYRSWVKVEEAKELQRVLDNIKEKVNES
jgi:predicted transcriptional regulator